MEKEAGDEDGGDAEVGKLAREKNVTTAAMARRQDVRFPETDCKANVQIGCGIDLASKHVHTT